MRRVEAADLPTLARGDVPPAGVRWRLPAHGDLNANLVSFPAGEGVGEHVNEELDVLIVGVAGTGEVIVDGVAHPVRPGAAILVPRGARRATRASAGRLSYLTVHRRREGGITLEAAGPRPG
jgi:quercetin dioxygenase-like cupin family protein